VAGHFPVVEPIPLHLAGGKCLVGHRGPFKEGNSLIREGINNFVDALWLFSQVSRGQGLRF
jgi:hypothetical protein